MYELSEEKWCISLIQPILLIQDDEFLGYISRIKLEFIFRSVKYACVRRETVSSKSCIKEGFEMSDPFTLCMFLYVRVAQNITGNFLCNGITNTLRDFIPPVVKRRLICCIWLK
jgi:hypothetical protein